MAKLTGKVDRRRGKRKVIAPPGTSPVRTQHVDLTFQYTDIQILVPH